MTVCPRGDADVIHLDSERVSIDDEDSDERRSGSRPGEPGLRDLHVGLDRHAQGRAGPPLRARQPAGLDARNYSASRPDDGLLAVTTLSFDIAALELFLPLVVGARVELVDRDVAADGPRLIERLADPRHHGHAGDARHLAASCSRRAGPASAG